MFKFLKCLKTLVNGFKTQNRLFCACVLQKGTCGFRHVCRRFYTPYGSSFLSLADLEAWHELHSGCKFSASKNSPPSRTGLMWSTICAKVIKPTSSHALHNGDACNTDARRLRQCVVWYRGSTNAPLVYSRRGLPPCLGLFSDGIIGVELDLRCTWCVIQ